MAQLPTPLLALVEAGRKRRILSRTQADRLVDYAQGKNLSDTASLRAWLGSADGLHPDLARKLAATLPPELQGALGPYLPLAHLADGGMGSVWLAVKDAQGDLVVVKTIKPSQGISETQGEDALRRFDREAKITRQLAHPNVVRCLDAGVTDKKEMFLVLEYVDSGDLRDLVDAKGGLTEALALAILYQVADGLAEAHRLKLIHRDIKPPNIFVSSNGTAKLADFGIARSTESNRTMLTMEGAIVGSPLYMSPEQILTDPTLDIRSDIYALGAVLYFCLAADAPYGGKLQEILHQHCTASVPDVRTKRPKVSDATQAIIAKAMTKDRAKRFQSPEELRSAIGEALQALGMRPSQPKDESTSLRDFSEGTARAVARDLATHVADLRSQTGLDEIATIADTGRRSADLATMAADLNAVDGQMTIAADLNASDGLMTITADLNRKDTQAERASVATVSTDFNPIATMTAILLAEEPQAPTPAPPKEPGTSATVVDKGQGTVARILGGRPLPAPPVVPVEGDLAAALASPWIVLGGGPTATPDHPAVFLFAQHAVRMGKLREAPIDLCLRNYPVAVHKDACQRISRSHCAVRYDAVGRHCLLEDLNAPNGTRLDGIPVAAGSSVTLATGVDNIVDLAGVVVLWIRCLPRTGPVAAPHPGFAPGAVGLDTDSAFDAVAMTRPENRPEMAYAQVLRRISVGGPGSDMTIGGTRTRAAAEVAVLGGRWIWRQLAAAGQPEAPWRPLVEGTELDCGGRTVRAAPGLHTLYG